jgi:hypothetical protein
MMRACVLTLVLATGAAAADPCEEHIDDPVAVPWRESGVDAARGGCLHADLSAVTRGHAVIDTPNFYGTLGGELTIAIRLLESSGFEWGVALRAVDGVFVQNAVLTVDEVGYGPVSGHIALGDRSELAGKPLARALYARLELPFTRSRLDGSTGALQVGAAATWLAAPRLRVHGHAALLGWYASSTGGRDGRAAFMTSVDAAYRAVRSLSIAAGADVQVGWYGWGLDHVAVHAGAHWRVKGLWRAELAAGAPLAGTERTDLAFTVAVRRDLD